MNNKEKFFACCKTLASIENCIDIIDILESIGLKVESSNSSIKSFANLLYGACDGPIDMAMALLHINDVTEYNKVYQDILSARMENYVDIATEAWNLYGIK